MVKYEWSLTTFDHKKMHETKKLFYMQRYSRKNESDILLKNFKIILKILVNNTNSNF